MNKNIIDNEDIFPPDIVEDEEPVIEPVDEPVDEPKKKISPDKVLDLLKMNIYEPELCSNINIAHIVRWFGALAEKSINKDKKTNKGNILFLSGHYDFKKNKDGKQCLAFRPVFSSSKGIRKWNAGRCWKVNDKFISFLNSTIYKQDTMSWFYAINEFADDHRRKQDLVAIRGLYCEDMTLMDVPYDDEKTKHIIPKLKEKNKELFSLPPSFLAVSSAYYDYEKLINGQVEDVTEDEMKEPLTEEILSGEEEYFNVRKNKTQAVFLFRNPESISNPNNCPMSMRGNQQKVIEYNKSLWQEYLNMLATNYNVNTGGSQLTQVYRVPLSKNTKRKKNDYDYYEVKQITPEPLIEDDEIYEKKGKVVYDNTLPLPFLDRDSRTDEQRYDDDKGKKIEVPEGRVDEFINKEIAYYDSRDLRKWILLEHIKKNKYFNEEIFWKLKEYCNWMLLENIAGFETVKKYYFGGSENRTLGSIAVRLAETKKFSREEIKHIMMNCPVYAMLDKSKYKEDAINDTINKAVEKYLREPSKNIDNAYAIEALSNAVDIAKDNKKQRTYGWVPRITCDYPKIFFSNEKEVKIKINEYNEFTRKSPVKLTKDIGLLLMQMIALAGKDGDYNTPAAEFFKLVGSRRNFYNVKDVITDIRFSCKYLYGKDFGIVPTFLFEFLYVKSGRVEYRLSEKFLSIYESGVRQLNFKIFQKLKQTKGRYTVPLYFFCLYHLYKDRRRENYKVIELMDLIGINTTGLEERPATYRQLFKRLKDSIAELDESKILNFGVQLAIEGSKDCQVIKVIETNKLPSPEITEM